MRPRRETIALQPVNQQQLAPGMILPGHLRDRTGRVLIQAGTLLGPRHLALLRQRGTLGLYAGPDWDRNPVAPPPHEKPAKPAEVLAALRGRRMGGAKMRVREHERYTWSVVLRLSIEEQNLDGCRRRDVVVRTGDISVSGFAFFYDQYIHPGTLLRARFETVPGRPYLIAVVRNCTHISARRHRIGAQFVKVRRGKAIVETQPRP